MSNALFIVDDHNLDSITYETPDSWFAKDNIDVALQGTVTEGLAGAKASVTFSGTAVAVFGIATTVSGAKPPAIQFAVDGKAVQITTAPNNGSTDFEYPFFDKEDLSSGQHVLEFTVLNATQAYPFALDFIAYLPISGAAPTASQEIVTSFLPAPSGATSVAPSASSSSGPPVGAIVGGVVGGVALLVAAAVAIYFLCFRHRRKEQPFFYASSAKPGDLLDDEAKPTPYEVQGPTGPPTPGLQSAYSATVVSAPSTYDAPSAYATPLPYDTPLAYAPSEAPGSDYSAGTSVPGPSQARSLYVANNVRAAAASPNAPRSKAAEAGLLSVPTPATYHADSGIRFNSAGEGSSSAHVANALAAPELADVPPSYSEA
ncbi:hypothetical protein BV20DRAFT_1032247 [Pilatotrama ljubarskyi]|nr:hypothetical protein BV20DRAFT_1032247 [Pilatotrama ljubarskyi]